MVSFNIIHSFDKRRRIFFEEKHATRTKRIGNIACTRSICEYKQRRK